MADDGGLKQIAGERDLAIERFVLMCKTMNQCMWDWDMRTNVAWYSDAIYGVFGIEQSTTPTFERWTTYVHPDDRERVISGFRAVVDNARSEWSDEYRFVRPSDNKILEVRDRGFVMFEDGRPVRMVGVVSDVTQQNTLERQLRHAQKMQAIGQLAGGIAHDFNNMLQAAKLEIELLRLVAGSSGQVLEHANQLGAAIDRAASLTRQLLVFSRLEAKRVEAIDLNAKVEELTTMLRRLIGENVALRVELAGGTVVVDADSSMLDQVLVNLAVNGRDAMARGGTLSISTSRCGHLGRAGRPPGSFVCLEVADTGAGIAADVLPRIFDPFFTTKANGTGLGLATVYGIVEQHGGWIDVDSAPGRGTRFRVYLPECSRAAAAQPTPPPRIATAGKETILLVEDDPGVRRALSLLIEGNGYDVIAVDSGAAALVAWETAGRPVDLVVSDVMMPGMSGRELATLLSTRRPEIAILLISGDSRNLDPSLATSYDVLHKPFSGESLLVSIRACLDKRLPATRVEETGTVAEA